MANRFRDWFHQGESDYKHAGHSFEVGDYDWCCFACHQAAEKALKAIFLKSGNDAWGHSLAALIGTLPPPARADEGLVTSAKILDKHYIPTRYPNGLDTGTPSESYTKAEATTALQCAEDVLEFARRQID